MTKFRIVELGDSTFRVQFSYNDSEWEFMDSVNTSLTEAQLELEIFKLYRHRLEERKLIVAIHEEGE